MHHFECMRNIFDNLFFAYIGGSPHYVTSTKNLKCPQLFTFGPHLENMGANDFLTYLVYRVRHKHLCIHLLFKIILPTILRVKFALKVSIKMLNLWTEAEMV